MAKNHWDTYATAVAREMGYQWRVRYLGMPDPSGHGYPSRSLSGKLLEEGVVGAGHAGSHTQFFEEFYTNDALLGRRALTALNEQERTAIQVHFFGQGIQVKLKAHMLGWAVRTYWWRLNRAMEKFALALRSLHKTVGEDLQKVA